MELKKRTECVYYSNPNIDHGIRPKIEKYELGNTYVSQSEVKLNVKLSILWNPSGGRRQQL